MRKKKFSDICNPTGINTHNRAVAIDKTSARAFEITKGITEKCIDTLRQVRAGNYNQPIINVTYIAGPTIGRPEDMVEMKAEITRSA